VESVNVVQVQGEGSGLGAIAGGVVGGVLGNQVGRGTGRKVATVAGAAGGAYAGHQAEKYYKSGKRYDVAVRMEDGSTRTFPFENEPGFRSGDRVRVVDGKLQYN
jgi:outer membrane lipoprotein SlyB